MESSRAVLADRGVNILSHETDISKLAEENERLKQYVRSSIDEISKEIDEMEALSLGKGGTDPNRRESIRMSLDQLKREVLVEAFADIDKT